MDPLVTIAIPTYKRLSYLKEAVASAINQTYSNIEIVIGQDPTLNGLNTDIKEWAQSISKSNSKVNYFFNKTNLGLAGNWNSIAENAKGEYILIIGDDDRLLPNTIQKLVSEIKSKFNVAFSNHYLIDSNGVRLEEDSIRNTKKFNRGNLLKGRIDNPSAIVWKNAIPISAALIRTEDVKRLKFKEDLNTPEIEFFLRLANEGGSFVFIPDYTVEYRIHSQSATHAGLNVHKLLRYLIPMEVENKNEKYKTLFIQGLIVSAVNLSFKEGNLNQARMFYNSKYYSPKLKFSLKGIIQGICIVLPSWFGIKIFNLLIFIRP